MYSYFRRLFTTISTFYIPDSVWAREEVVSGPSICSRWILLTFLKSFWVSFFEYIDCRVYPDYTSTSFRILLYVYWTVSSVTLLILSVFLSFCPFILFEYNKSIIKFQFLMVRLDRSV